MRLSVMTTREKVISGVLAGLITLIVNGMAHNITW